MSARHHRSKRDGFTLVEVLIATAITAIVMAGLCAAVNATVQSCRANESMLDSSGRARLALGQIERSIRKADAVVRTSATRLDIVDETGKAIAYEYDGATNRLNLVMDLAATNVVLARNVSAVTFTAQNEPDPNTQVSRVVRVTIAVTVAVGSESHTYKSSVAPRRARTYQ